MAKRVALNTKAYQGQQISLSDFYGRHIFLVFNRGFT